MSIADKSDGELLAQFVATGIEAPFEELVGRHAEMVLRICMRIGGSREDAEDAMQAVFATLADRAGSLHQCRSLAGWLYRVAWHTSLRMRRSALTRHVHERAAGKSSAGVYTMKLDEEQVKFELHHALNALPEEYREALVLHYLEELTIEQAAELGMCKVGTMAARLSRGRELLRERMERRGILVPTAIVGVLLADQGEPEPVPPAMIKVMSQSSALAGRVAAAGLCESTGLAAGGVGPWAWWAKIKFAAALFVVGTCSAMASAPAYQALLKESSVSSIEKEEATAKVGLSRPTESEKRTDESYAVSGSAVPEPGTLTVVGMGGIILLMRRRGGRRREG